MQITTNHQIQVKTKTPRHQLHKVWLNVESAQPGSKTVSVTTPEGASWRCPRSLVTLVRAKGSNGAGVAPSTLAQQPEFPGRGAATPPYSGNPVTFQTQICDLQDRMKELEAKVRLMDKIILDFQVANIEVHDL